LYAEIVHRAHKAGWPVPRSCVEGFGATSAIDRPHVFRLSEDMPMLIVIADEEDRIQSFLPQLDELDISGLITLDEVEVLRYAAAERKRQRVR
jgi:PII-like signaling protein